MYFEVENDLIDWNNVFSGIILKNTSQEALCEEET